MALPTVKLGDKVKCYLDGFGDLSPTTTTKSITATVIILEPGDNFQPFALGWKKDETHPGNAVPVFTPETYGPKRTLISTLKDFDYQLWPTQGYAMELISEAEQKAAAAAGAHCTSCSDFFPHAEASNAFRCWSCKNYRHYNSSSDDDD